MNDCLAVILGGGRGSRLFPLTQKRSKPAVPIAGKYRLIDIPISNCLNSGLRRIFVLTQYNSESLNKHVAQTYKFDVFTDGFVSILAAEQTEENPSWFQGTADAVRQVQHHLRGHRAREVLILSGDQLYQMDYRAMRDTHRAAQADATVAVIPVAKEQTAGFGIAQVDSEDRIVAFVEKPEDPPGIPGNPEHAFASMGIYLFKADFLYKALIRDAEDPDSGHDFGKDIIPRLVHEARVYAHRFENSCIPNEGHPDPYWRDVGSVDSYWEANMDLTSVVPALNLYDETWPITTHQEQLPPAKFVHAGEMRNGVALSSLVSGGCVISGAHVHHSLLSSRVFVHSHARLDGAMVLPDCDIGRHARLRRCIVARDCRIPEGLVVGEDPEEDARRFYRTPGGVTLISQRMLNQLEP
jgi:glucose-1-phosphate adenylyltransferase